ncbi:hypothetical protein EK21DRAFT_99292 [Setomelanomma holmii]|uniref:Uncharacterized protein n=1 Tax=Setomelanomma holmii TaxID=210430 RepID=A0A9P4LNE6_9PLEO|nr:hypothetical protein EK21DRAFT_99292 [Setomelanomma holmii]
MPPTLHPHLKRGLDLDDYRTDLEDLIEDMPREAATPEEQAAKRQRVEKIAAQYLRGKQPVILSAGLRGPFNNGWKNPWAKAKKEPQSMEENDQPMKDHNTDVGAKQAPKAIGVAKTKRRTRRAGRKTVEAVPVASPETSRAVDDDKEDMNDTYTLELFEVPPATASSQSEHNTSGPTEFFMPNSSIGFVYQKVAGTKWTVGNAPRSKPRAMNFNSSPALKKNKTSNSIPLNGSNENEADKDEMRLAEADVSSQSKTVAAGRQAIEQEREEQSAGSRRASRQSMMSTQAAMLLAQLEFQESTFPTSPSVSFRPWSQPQDETPRAVMAELSPAMTPLSVFKPELDQPDAFNSVLRDPPISTQDLFAAASPFAFSTVKKKPIAPQRSKLRVAMIPFDEVGEGVDDAVARSLSSSPGRIPLKDKNIARSPWSFTVDKCIRASQESLGRKERRIDDDVESPQLDLHGSMDDYGPSGSLHFADRLIRNLNGT